MPRTSTSRSLWLAATALSSMLICGPALAQSAATEAQNDQTAGVNELPEIVVTATRQAQALSKVPLSVVAYTQETMDLKGVRRADDIVRITPGVSLSRSSRSDRQGAVIAIRGINSGAGAATVGVYIDDTPVQPRPVATNSMNPYPLVFDLDRVEVLRGPQGTLFGAGSEGGTLRFITPSPSLSRFSAYVRAEGSLTKDARSAGSAGGELGVAVGGPIVQDKLGLRVSLYERRDAGFVDRVDVRNTRVVESNANWQDSKSARVALAWEPVAGLTITPSVFFQQTYSNDTAQYFQSYSNPGSTSFRNGNPIAQPGKDKFILPALKVELNAGPAVLISNTSFLSRHRANVIDSSLLDEATLGGFTTLPPPSPLDQVISSGNIGEDAEVFTQEVRLQNRNPDARLNWVIGGFYQRSHQKQDYSIVNPSINDLIRANPAFAGLGPNRTVETLFGGVGLYQGRYVLVSTTNVKDTAAALFANADFKITEKLKLTAGLRWSDTKYESVGFSAGPVVSSNGRTTILSQKADPVTPKVGLSYQATEGTMVYASAAKGFRIGSATGVLAARCAGDAAAIGLSLDPRQITPDYVWSYEAGSKGRYFDGRLQLNGSVYRIDWKNIQSGITLPNCNVPTTANLGSARSQGFELEATAKLTNDLLVSASVGHTDAKFTTTTLGAANAAGVQPVIRSAGQPLGASPWMVSLSGEYTFEVFSRRGYVRGDLQYQSHDSTPLDLAVATTDRTIPRPPAFTNLDLRAGVRTQGLDLSVFVANVGDAHPAFGAFRETTASNIYHSSTIRPRTVGVTLSYRY